MAHTPTHLEVVTGQQTLRLPVFLAVVMVLSALFQVFEVTSPHSTTEPASWRDLPSCWGPCNWTRIFANQTLEDIVYHRTPGFWQRSTLQQQQVSRRLLQEDEGDDGSADAVDDQYLDDYADSAEGNKTKPREYVEYFPRSGEVRIRLRQTPATGLFRPLFLQFAVQLFVPSGGSTSLPLSRSPFSSRNCLSLTGEDCMLFNVSVQVRDGNTSDARWIPQPIEFGEEHLVRLDDTSVPYWTIMVSRPIRDDFIVQFTGAMADMEILLGNHIFISSGPALLVLSVVVRFVSGVVLLCYGIRWFLRMYGSITRWAPQNLAAALVFLATLASACDPLWTGRVWLASQFMAFASAMCGVVFFVVRVLVWLFLIDCYVPAVGGKSDEDISEFRRRSPSPRWVYAFVTLVAGWICQIVKVKAMFAASDTLGLFGHHEVDPLRPFASLLAPSSLFIKDEHFEMGRDLHGKTQFLQIISYTCVALCVLGLLWVLLSLSLAIHTNATLQRVSPRSPLLQLRVLALLIVPVVLFDAQVLVLDLLDVHQELDYDFTSPATALLWAFVAPLLLLVFSPVDQPPQPQKGNLGEFQHEWVLEEEIDSSEHRVEFCLETSIRLFDFARTSLSLSRPLTPSDPEHAKDYREWGFHLDDSLCNDLGLVDFFIAHRSNRIVVSFHLKNLTFELHQLDILGSNYPPEAKVGSQFLSAFTSVETPLRESLLAAVDSIRQHNDSPVLVEITGFGGGGAVATIAALELRRLYIADKNISFSLYTFGTSRVGNALFSRLVNDSLSCSKRVVLTHDPCTTVPGFGVLWRHAGVECLVDTYGGVYVDPLNVETVLRGWPKLGPGRPDLFAPMYYSKALRSVANKHHLVERTMCFREPGLVQSANRKPNILLSSDPTRCLLHKRLQKGFLSPKQPASDDQVFSPLDIQVDEELPSKPSPVAKRAAASPKLVIKGTHSHKLHRSPSTVDLSPVIEQTDSCGLEEDAGSTLCEVEED